MTDETERYKKAPSRKKKAAPGKRIVVSEETRRAYEKAVNERHARERDYGRFLGPDNKPR